MGKILDLRNSWQGYRNRYRSTLQRQLTQVFSYTRCRVLWTLGVPLSLVVLGSKETSDDFGRASLLWNWLEWWLNGAKQTQQRRFHVGCTEHCGCVSCMSSAVKILHAAFKWQAKFIGRNPILGAAYLGIATIFLVFWIPVQAHNLAGLHITITVPAMFILQSINLFAVFRKVSF